MIIHIFFNVTIVCFCLVLIGLSRVARGVDTLILPDRRSQGCLALRVPARHPPRDRGGGRKTKAAFKKNPLQKGFQKRDPPPPPEFNQALLRGGVVGGRTAKIVSPLAL